MDTINISGTKLTREQLEALIEQYFDCTLSAEQEQLLRHALARCPWKGEAINEARFAMGFASVGRQLRQHHGRHTLWLRAATVAAAVAIVATVGIRVLSQQSSTANQCVAYVNGEQVDDPSKVMSLVRGDLDAVASAHNDMHQAMLQQLSSVGAAADN